MRAKDGLKTLISSLGWEPESENVGELLTQLSSMIEVRDGGIGVLPEPEYAAKVGKRGFDTVADAIAAADNRTVKLMADAVGPIAVPAGMSVTVDLCGHEVTSGGIAFDNAGNLVVRNGTVASTGSFAFHARTGSRTRVEKCVVTSVEGAAVTGKNSGSLIELHDCDLSASDNAVLAGNGTEGCSGNRFVVRGCTLRGAIKTSGYVACGIYCPNDDEFDVRDTTIAVTGGCGVCSRAGRTKLRDVTITTTGTATGKVGDSRVVVPCSALVFDEEAAYPALSDEDGITALSCLMESDADLTTVLGDGDRIEVV